MKKLFVLLLFCFISVVSLAQVKAFDKLELNYSQENYKLVYRRANRLMDNPEYDYSQLPLYYKSISLFQLSMSDRWSSRQSFTVNAAKEAYTLFLKHPDSRKIIAAHSFEISALKQDLQGYLEELKRLNKKKDFDTYRTVLVELFDKIPAIEPVSSESLPGLLSGLDGSTRGKVIKTASQFLGVPYVWAGESPTGFDCSGFTSYVMKQNGKAIPRTAAEQFEASKKIKDKQADKGDLVFFSNGSRISHVGMIVSEKGKPLVMIHASSSKGIVLTELEKSTYWMSRLAGFGTFMY
jgi:cell wall-associated NlpC family hydrolase